MDKNSTGEPEKEFLNGRLAFFLKTYAEDRLSLPNHLLIILDPRYRMRHPSSGRSLWQQSLMYGLYGSGDGTYVRE
jgi:hypothetical protein